MVALPASQKPLGGPVFIATRGEGSTPTRIGLRLVGLGVAPGRETGWNSLPGFAPTDRIRDLPFLPSCGGRNWAVDLPLRITGSSLTSLIFEFAKSAARVGMAKWRSRPSEVARWEVSAYESISMP